MREADFNRDIFMKKFILNKNKLFKDKILLFKIFIFTLIVRNTWMAKERARARTRDAVQQLRPNQKTPA